MRVALAGTESLAWRSSGRGSAQERPAGSSWCSAYQLQPVACCAGVCMGIVQQIWACRSARLWESKPCKASWLCVAAQLLQRAVQLGSLVQPLLQPRHEGRTALSPIQQLAPTAPAGTATQRPLTRAPHLWRVPCAPCCASCLTPSTSQCSSPRRSVHGTPAWPSATPHSLLQPMKPSQPHIPLWTPPACSPCLGMGRWQGSALQAAPAAAHARHLQSTPCR